MKKVRNLFFVMLVSIFINTNISSAQCPTPNDYLGTPFNYGGTRVIEISPGCFLNYEWCWRNAGPYHDIYIGNMWLTGTGCTGNELDDYANNIDLATGDVILNENPWGADPIPECPTLSQNTWRQGHGGCYTDPFWKYYPAENAFYLTVEPCDNLVHKCWETFQVCWVWDPTYATKKAVFTKNTYVFGASCPPAGGPNNDIPCNPVCE